MLVNFEVDEAVVAEVQLMPETVYETKVKTEILYEIIRGFDSGEERAQAPLLRAGSRA